MKIAEFECPPTLYKNSYNNHDHFIVINSNKHLDPMNRFAKKGVYCLSYTEENYEFNLLLPQDALP